MPAHIELEDFVTSGMIERAYRRATELLRAHDHTMADIGWRAACDRNPKLLKVLEKGAEIITALSENQTGLTRRSTFDRGDLPRVVEHTEAQLWRQAYEWADKGEPAAHCRWIYAGAAEAAGLRP